MILVVYIMSESVHLVEDWQSSCDGNMQPSYRNKKHEINAHLREIENENDA